MQDEAKLEYELRRVDQEIDHYSRFVKEIESSVRLKIFHSKDLRKFKEEIEKQTAKKNEILKKLEVIWKEQKEERLKKKNEQCELLIADISLKKNILTENGESIDLPDEVKESFIDMINNFKNSDSFEYVYSQEENENYVVTESLVLNHDNQIDIVYTFNDLFIAAKKHQHYKSLNEMLMQYMKYLEKNKKDSDQEERQNTR